VCTTTSNDITDFPSIDEMFRKLVAAIQGLATPELDKAEVLRLRRIIAGIKVYE
jgi:hypothetical protein